VAKLVSAEETDQINYGVDGYSPEKKLSWNVRVIAECVVIVKTFEKS